MTEYQESCPFDVFEGMTSISAVIKSIREGLSNRTILKVLYDENKHIHNSRELKFLHHVSSEMEFPLIPTTVIEIEKLTSGTTHGGIIALCSKRSFQSLNVNYLTNKTFIALLEGIEDPYNFGYSIRSLYAAGADGIILPPRNWMEFSGTVARSSAGTSELIDICISDSYEAAKFCNENGIQIVCAGIRDSVSYCEHDFTKPTLLVIGGEKRGISRKVLDLADVTVRIDYGREFIGSLPSASAIAVLAFEIARQRKTL